MTQIIELLYRTKGRVHWLFVLVMLAVPGSYFQKPVYAGEISPDISPPFCSYPFLPRNGHQRQNLVHLRYCLCYTFLASRCQSDEFVGMVV
jgi:hypothetical protein